MSHRQRVAQQDIVGEEPRGGECFGRRGGGRLYRAARYSQARVPGEQPNADRRWIGSGLVERALDDAGEFSGLAGGRQAFVRPSNARVAAFESLTSRASAPPRSKVSHASVTRPA